MAVLEMSNLEVQTLFQAWGFVPESGNGGHIRMRHGDSDRIVQITAPGRKAPTPFRALKKAADIVGVGVHEFRAGPPCNGTKKPHGGAKVPDLEALDAQLRAANDAARLAALQEDDMDDVAEALRTTSSITTTESSPWQNPEFGPTERIVQFLRAHAGQEMSKDTIVRQTDLTDTQVNGAMTNLVKSRDEIQRPRRGVYVYDDTAERRRAEEEERRRALEQQVEEAKQASCYTRIGEDKHGRVVLTGPDGEMWIAIRVEPHFHSFTAR